MNGYLIERPELNGSCCMCGGPTCNDDFCSIDCMHLYCAWMEQESRSPMSERQCNARVAQYHEPWPEGVELDINMERLRELRSNRESASDLGRKLSRDFKRMKG